MNSKYQLDLMDHGELRAAPKRLLFMVESNPHHGDKVAPLSALGLHDMRIVNRMYDSMVAIVTSLRSMMYADTS